MNPLWIGLGLAILLGLAALAPAYVRFSRRREARRALALFAVRRELLEARFFELAAQTGKPRGLRWKHCDWKNQVVFGREVGTGLITALAAVEIHFEAVEGGDMEDVEAVSDVREASALFHFQQGLWGTGGKALFNMSPQQALARLEGQYEPLES